MKKTIGIILLLGLVACETPTDENSDKATKISTEKQNLESQNKEETIFGSELEFVKYSHQQLREGNLKTLKKITDGTILFSPYAYIDTASARIVPVNQLIEPSDEIHYWGDYDATGDAINMTTEAYLDKYVFSFNIEAENVVVQTLDGKPKAYGSELHNMHEMYPDAKFVEFYHRPSKEGYLDWKALIFVVEESDGEYILKAIIHNQWTA